jgi:hypothetical protein
MSLRNDLQTVAAARLARRLASRQMLGDSVRSAIEPIERRVMLSGSIGINFADGTGTTGVGTNSYNLAPTDVAGQVPIGNWNNAHSTAGGNGVTGTLSGLTDDAGTATSASVAWQANGTWDAATQENQTDQFPAGPNHSLMAGYLDNFGGTATAPPTAVTTGLGATNGVLVSGLTGTSYNIYCYDLQAVIGRGGGITVTGTNSSTQSIITSQQYSTFIQGNAGDFLLFPGVQPKNGNILFSTDGTSFRVSFEGLELVPNTSTTPPAPVSGLTAAFAPSTASVNLAFTDNDSSVLKFQVLRSTSASGPFSQVDLITPNSTGNYTFSDTAITPGQSYFYEVIAQNGAGNSAPSNIAGPVAVPTNIGAEAHYYNTAYWAGTPAVSTQVITVNENNPSPDPAIRASDNSTAFTGKIRTDAAGTYTFISNTDDDGYLWVDGQLVSSDATTSTNGGHGTRNASTLFPISLAANTSYDFVFLQSQGGGGAGANMLWVEPNGMTPVIIPGTNLTPTSDTPQTPSILAVDPFSSQSPNPNAHAVDFAFDSDNRAVVKYLLQRRPGSSSSESDWATVNQTDPQGSLPDFTNPGEFSIHIEDASALPGTSYQYRVVAMNFDHNSTPSSVVNVSTPALPAQSPGVEARFFNGELAFSPENPRNIMVNGTPSEFLADSFGIVVTGATGSSAPIDINLNNSSPDPAGYPDVYRIHPNDYASLFTGKIRTDAAGTYTFITNTDDDGYMWVNDVLVSSDPGGHGQQNARNVVPISLAANTEYDFIMVQQQVGGGSGFHASWIEPDGMGGSLPISVIPANTSGGAGGFEMNMDAPNKQTINGSGAIVTDNTQSAAAQVYLQSSTAAGNAIAWTDQSFSEVWFQVERSTDGTNFSAIGKAGFDTNTFTDTTAVTGTHYFYRVRGMNFDSAAGTASNMVDTANVTLPVPALTAATCVPNQVELSWPGQSSFSGGFEIQYHDNTSSTFIDVPGASALPNSTTSFAVAGLDPTKTYTFQIRNLAGTGAIAASAFSAPVTSPATGAPAVSHSSGFAGATDIHTNGNSSLTAVGANTVLQLTPQANNQVGTAFDTNIQGIDAFNTTFDFQFDQGTGNPQADGFTFIIQNPGVDLVGVDALGGGGGSLGYSGIGTKSVAIKFDLWNGGPADSTTGVYTAGEAVNDTLGATPGLLHVGYSMEASGVKFHTNFADTFRANLKYDGTTLTETVTDLTTNAVFTMAYAVNIPQIVGSNCAFVGFGGGTGGANAEQDIVNWSYTALPAVVQNNPVSNTINGTAGNDTITIKKDADGTHDDIWLNVATTGAPSQQALIASPIVINSGGGTDTLVFDSSAGNPIPSGSAGIRLNGGTGTFTIGGTVPTLDATHVVDVGTSTVNIPYTGTSILPAVQSDLKNGFIKSTDAAGSTGKFGVADTDTGTAVKLQYAVIGDTNVDGHVNFTDLLSLAQNYNKTGQDWAHGDFNYDGTVNFSDLLALAQHYGQSSAVTAAASSSSLDLLASARKAKPLARKR